MAASVAWSPLFLIYPPAPPSISPPTPWISSQRVLVCSDKEVSAGDWCRCLLLISHRVFTLELRTWNPEPETQTQFAAEATPVEEEEDTRDTREGEGGGKVGGEGGVGAFGLDRKSPRY